MAEWQPIETAPRDIMILGVNARGKKYRVGHSFQSFSRRATGNDPDAVIDPVTGRFTVCTHWMKLPEPPDGA